MSKGYIDAGAIVLAALIGGAAVMGAEFVAHELGKSDPPQREPALIVYVHRDDLVAPCDGEGGSQVLARPFDRMCGRVDPAVRRAALYADAIDLALTNGYRDPDRIGRAPLRVPRDFVCPRTR